MLTATYVRQRLLHFHGSGGYTDTLQCYITHLGDFSQSDDANVGVMPQATAASTQGALQLIFITHATIQHYMIKYRSIIK